MYSDHIWLCLEGMAIALDGNSDAVQAPYEQAWLKWTQERRAEIREQIVSAIGALARLETRLADHDDSNDHD